MKIRMLKTIRPDYPFILVRLNSVLAEGKVYEAFRYKDGSVCGIDDTGVKLGVKPGEFEIVEEDT